MYEMKHDIRFNNETGNYRLKLLNEVSINSSVESLVDTATITLPESVLNTVLDLEKRIFRGTSVSISLGYNDELQHEFSGYVTEVVNRNGSLQIECEDALFLFRKTVADKQFAPAPVKTVLQYLIDQVDSSYRLNMDVDYGITYEKFTIYKAEAYDVLKKIQDELKANIYFDTATKILNFYAPYKNEAGVVSYNMFENVESSSLEYKRAINRKVEVVITSTGKDGSIKEIKLGTPGGEQVNMKVGAMSESDMKKIADVVLDQRLADKYEGGITTWLVPYVKPSYRAKIKDKDYPDRNGSYYVNEVNTTFSDGGGKREIKFGIKL